MVTTYTVLTAIHILAAATWVGGGSFVTMLVSRARRETDPERLSGLVRTIRPIAQRVFPGSGAVLVVTGFWMIYNFGWPYETWVVLGIIGWAYSFVTGGALIGPTVDKAVARYDEGGPTDPQALAFVNRMLMLARFDSLVLALVVIDMVIKPGS
jgi:uncharacterized membrane protein